MTIGKRNEKASTPCSGKFPYFTFTCHGIHPGRVEPVTAISLVIIRGQLAHRRRCIYWLCCPSR